ncbi:MULTISPECIES: hypothetical protein [Sphingobacterium]|uniref:Uncharacterized protein n=1 Tax=Sphingobacterium cellulitidis TaxID=1768011 RepID=A0A8H9KUF6_9SPHI|nr:MULTISPECIES: hypothetical protein [Sphingobacterium]MBA8987636.1 hypothetical protein [Sphingobacterium soli]WFB64309.1 hypothetical protein PZ892_03675 [Sphingobacterium sp. WM]GGE21916.1 hypothetical protein GCM10011516_19410 [Sphingobacterium soli]
MKGKILLFFIITLLFGCKEEDMSPVDGEFNKALLEKYIWKNNVLIDEVFTDNSNPEHYNRTTTLSFTGTQYSHIVQDSVKGNMDAQSRMNPLAIRTSEYWGDYTFNGLDSTITLSYRVNEKVLNKMNISSDSLIIHSSYKIISLSEDELTLKLKNDSVMHGYNTVMTFKPVK